MPPGRRRFTTNNLGFRGDFMPQPKPANEYRIFMVGGSTTENFYLDDTETITFILQQQLNQESRSGKSVRVYAAGLAGTNSADHLMMISGRIVHLEPDMIIVFCGANDLFAAIARMDYSFSAVLNPPRFSSRDLAVCLATELQLGRYGFAFVRRVRGRSAEATTQEIGSVSNYRQKAALRKQAPAARSRPRTDLRSYEENPRSIIGIAQAHGISILLVTQASTWRSRDRRAAEWHWMTRPHEVTYPEEWMEEALEGYKDVMRRLGREFNIMVFDLARNMEKSADFLYDDYHFTVEGARLAGEGLA